MFTRLMTCTFKPEKREEFLEAARKLPSAYKGESGFVDLLTFVSDEHPNRALMAAIWKTKGDSDAFYKRRAPLLDLKPYLEHEEIEHYFLETSSTFKITASQAA